MELGLGWIGEVVSYVSGVVEDVTKKTAVNGNPFVRVKLVDVPQLYYDYVNPVAWLGKVGASVGLEVSMTAKGYITIQSFEVLTPSYTWIFDVFTVVPPEFRQSVYRALSKVLHPDQGGDAAAMVELNRVHDALARQEESMTSGADSR